MGSGDASRTWFPEMVDELRKQWHPGVTMEELIGLTSRLDDMLQQIRKESDILPPMFRCPHCGRHERAAASHVSVRATILSLGRFAITSADEVKVIERRWKKHREANDLDQYGKRSQNQPVHCTGESAGQ